MVAKINIEKIISRVKTVAANCGRNFEEIKILAVSKTRNAEEINFVINNGITRIAENKIQEIESKMPDLDEKLTEFHYIGHLQSNKINKLMALQPTLIHSIDKLSTAKKLNNYLEKNNIKQDILIQVNTSEEESKFGVAVSETFDFAKQLSELPNLNVIGLMTIGMNTDNRDIIRKCFKTLKELSWELAEIPNIEMKELSMGMSNDFEVAIEEGATLLRIGSLMFGPRNYR